MQEITKAKMASFTRITEREVIKKDREFIGKIMRLDWRDRLTAKELLDDEWRRMRVRMNRCSDT
jgi:hypothetical protein